LRGMTPVAQLFFLPGAGSFAPHVMLEEAGIAHELQRVVRDEHGVPTEPAGYLALNPAGRIPTIVWANGTVQTESAAICLTAAEAAKRDSLIPPVGEAERAEVLARLVFLTNTVQVAVLRARYAARFVDGAEAQAAVSSHANHELKGLAESVATWYSDDQAFIRGAKPGVDDVFLGMLIRWTRLTDNPWWDVPALGAFYDRFHALPSVTHAREREGDFAPRPPAGE
jgi:glutathione S-transferase